MMSTASADDFTLDDILVDRYDPDEGGCIQDGVGPQEMTVSEYAEKFHLSILEHLPKDGENFEGLGHEIHKKMPVFNAMTKLLEDDYVMEANEDVKPPPMKDMVEAVSKYLRHAINKGNVSKTVLDSVENFKCAIHSAKIRAFFKDLKQHKKKDFKGYAPTSLTKWILSLKRFLVLFGRLAPELQYADVLSELSHLAKATKKVERAHKATRNTIAQFVAAGTYFSGEDWIKMRKETHRRAEIVLKWWDEGNPKLKDPTQGVIAKLSSLVFVLTYLLTRGQRVQYFVNIKIRNILGYINDESRPYLEVFENEEKVSFIYVSVFIKI